MKVLFSAAAALLLAPAYAWSCNQDIDCGANGRCLKSSGAIYGTCVRDVLPDEANRPPVPLAGALPLDKEHCAFDADCGPRRTCLRASATATGICVKER